MAKEKILIIDDEKDFVGTIAEWLWARDFNVIRAFSGKDGLEKAHSENPDLILLDIAMPEMSGFDVCRSLKLDQRFKDIPVVMLTAKFQPSDIKFGEEMGADLYLTKPPELEHMLREIKALLRLKKIKNNRKSRATN